MNISVISEVPHPLPLVNRNTFKVSMLILLAPLFATSALGIVTNALNIAVFVRQGLTSDSTTLSLFALALSDILGCIFMLPHSVCFYLEEFVVTDNVFVNNCVNLITMSATYPRVIFVQITCWITVYISIERALCVLFPLRVKFLICTTNTAVVMIFIFAAEIVGHIPFMMNSLILWVPDPVRNKTLVAVNYQTPIGTLLYRLSNLIESSILTTTAMLIISLATVAIVTQVKTSSVWRNTLTNKSVSTYSKSTVVSPSMKTSELQNDKISIKDRETVRVVMSVTILFLTCLTMSHFPGLAMYVIPEFSLDGYNSGLFHLFYTFKFNLDSLNASVNFFFYKKQSSKFRNTYNKLFRPFL